MNVWSDVNTLTKCTGIERERSREEKAIAFKGSESWSFTSRSLASCDTSHATVHFSQDQVQDAGHICTHTLLLPLIHCIIFSSHFFSFSRQFFNPLPSVWRTCLSWPQKPSRECRQWKKRERNIYARREKKSPVECLVTTCLDVDSKLQLCRVRLQVSVEI